METCLISGQSGFLGSALTKRLTQMGWEVSGILREVLYHPKSLNKLVRGIKPDYIVHCAAYGNKHGQDEELEMVMANIDTTLNLLYATADIPYKAFINIGSSSEYGVKDKPMNEIDSLDTTTFYGATKASSTLLCRAFATKYHKPVVTARPFSLYGDGDDPNHFIPTVIRAFKENETLKLAPGTHDWIHVEDFIDGLLLTADRAEKLQGQAVNIGTGYQTTNSQIVSTVRDISEKPGKIQKVEQMRDYDNKNWVADNIKLLSLGWKQKHILEEDLKYMWTKALYEN